MNLGNQNLHNFYTLDLARRYHEVVIDQEDRGKTAFSFLYQHLQFKRLLFGIKTVPALFQSLLNQVLSGLQAIKYFVYFDDLVVFAKNLDEDNGRKMELDPIPD